MKRIMFFLIVIIIILSIVLTILIINKTNNKKIDDSLFMKNLENYTIEEIENYIVENELKVVGDLFPQARPKDISSWRNSRPV